MATDNQNFILAEGDDQTIEFTVAGVDKASDITAASWVATQYLDGNGRSVAAASAHVIHHNDEVSPGGLAAADVDGAVVVTLTLAAADTEDYPGAYNHRLRVTVDGESKRVAKGRMVVDTDLADPA